MMMMKINDIVLYNYFLSTRCQSNCMQMMYARARALASRAAGDVASDWLASRREPH